MLSRSAGGLGLRISAARATTVLAARRIGGHWARPPRRTGAKRGLGPATPPAGRGDAGPVRQLLADAPAMPPPGMVRRPPTVGRTAPPHGWGPGRPPARLRAA